MAETLAAISRWALSALSAAAIVCSVASSPSRADDAVASASTNPYAGRADIAGEGRSLFNQYCSHCHRPNAVQGERPRDLRRLKIRYGDKAQEVFLSTISHLIAQHTLPHRHALVGPPSLPQFDRFLIRQSTHFGKFDLWEKCNCLLWQAS